MAHTNRPITVSTMVTLTASGWRSSSARLPYGTLLPMGNSSAASSSLPAGTNSATSSLPMGNSAIFRPTLALALLLRAGGFVDDVRIPGNGVVIHGDAADPDRLRRAFCESRRSLASPCATLSESARYSAHAVRRASSSPTLRISCFHLRSREMSPSAADLSFSRPSSHLRCLSSPAEPRAQSCSPCLLPI